MSDLIELPAASGVALHPRTAFPRARMLRAFLHGSGRGLGLNSDRVACPTETEPTTCRAVRAPSKRTNRLAAALSLEIPNPLGEFRPSGLVENVLERFFGALVLDTLVEHQPLDDPAVEAERIQPLGCVGVEKLGVGMRVTAGCVRR